MLEFEEFDSLHEHLLDLNYEQGISPEVAGYDRLNRPVIAWLIESGGDETWPLGLTLSGLLAERPVPADEAHLSALAYPVRIAPHPQSTDSEGRA